MPYVHQLTPSDPSFVPNPAQVADYFQRLSEVGALPKSPRPTVVVPSGKFREGMNPFTRQVERYPMPDFLEVAKTSELAKQLSNRPEYCVRCESGDAPRLPPLKMFDLTGSEDLTKQCTFEYSATLQPESALAQHHTHLKPDRFFLSIECGKFVLPEFFEENDASELNEQTSTRVHPAILDAAEAAFRVPMTESGVYEPD